MSNSTSSAEGAARNFIEALEHKFMMDRWLGLKCPRCGEPVWHHAVSPKPCGLMQSESYYAWKAANK